MQRPSPFLPASATTTPMHFDNVYRSVVPGPVAAAAANSVSFHQSRDDGLPINLALGLHGNQTGDVNKALRIKSKEGRHTTLQGGIPRLPWPIEAYSLSPVHKYTNEDPRIFLEKLGSKGCRVEQLNVNEYKCHVDDDNSVDCAFIVSIWDVTGEKQAGANQYLLDIQRVNGCPFLFQSTISTVVGGCYRKRFRCLPMLSENNLDHSIAE